ncbi:hypothetical protein DSO57_1003345 [Entomophthora muscae]|uniref:Uncharacterized protein n=1 Tax=Entomophthora muscae TaxID=34485 RepID=A0ACC2U6Z7_9FUNG|nr:hypothetical protein DSO57_1003345 [Entomophthora muscae]
MLTSKTSKAQIHDIAKPAGHPCYGPVSALGGNSSLPDFYFGEDVLALLDKVETFTVGYTEEQKIKYLLNSLYQNSFDTVMPYLGFIPPKSDKAKTLLPTGCTKASPFNDLRITSTPQDCHLGASENSNDSRNSPESPNAPIAESLNKVKHSDSLACEVNQVSKALYLEEEDQVEIVENIFEPKESLTEVEPTKSPIIHEEYSEKKQDLVHEVNSMDVLISRNKGTSLAAPITLLYLDLLEPSTVDHNIRGEDSAKDDDVVLHEVEIVGLHTFQKPPLSLPEPLPPEDSGTAKPFPIEAGDCFKDEKVSEDNEASQEEKVVALLISQVEYRSLAEDVTVPLLSLPKSLPPKEPSFILQPHNKSCS